VVVRLERVASVDTVIAVVMLTVAAAAAAAAAAATPIVDEQSCEPTIGDPPVGREYKFRWLSRL